VAVTLKVRLPPGAMTCRGGVMLVITGAVCAMANKGANESRKSRMSGRVVIGNRR
jgi:hypothetical protein